MKAKIKSTGEIVDVFDYRFGSKISSENFVVYTDSHGHVHLDSDVDFSEDFEEVSDEEARQSDRWEQRRYEIAKSVLQGFCANPEPSIVQGTTFQQITEWSIEIADLLIAELKKGGTL